MKLAEGSWVSGFVGDVAGVEGKLRSRRWGVGGLGWRGGVPDRSMCLYPDLARAPEPFLQDYAKRNQLCDREVFGDSVGHFATL